MKGLRYVSSCFWLFVPILLFNVLFARRLPPAYRMQVFSKDVPLAVAIPERLLRIMPFEGGELDGVLRRVSRL